MSVTLTFPVTLVSSLGRLYPAFPAKNRLLYLVSEKQKIHNKNNNNTTTKNHPIDKKKTTLYLVGIHNYVTYELFQVLL